MQAGHLVSTNKQATRGLVVVGTRHDRGQPVEIKYRDGLPEKLKRDRKLLSMSGIGSPVRQIIT
jgi:hypothetical protein